MMSPQFQTIAQIVIGRILNSLPEGLLVALFAWVTLRLLPRQNSRTRFAVWFVALLAVAGLPMSALPGSALPLIGGIASGYTLLAAGSARPLITIPGAWGILLFLAWVVAACVAMLRLTAGLWRLRGLRRNCTAIDSAQLDPTIRKTLTNFSSSRSVTLATSEKVSVPAAVGFFKPMIVIPTWALRELPPEDLNIILLHEFAHLRRWDDWTNLLQKVVRAVFLFHPAVWWIDSRLALEREMACDDEVLAETANPRGYAKCLIGLLEKSFARRGWTMAQAAVHRAREASLRLAQILDSRRPHARHVWKPAIGIVGAFSLVCLVVVARVPKFVAFDRSTPAILGDGVHAPTLIQPEFPAVAAIPAGLRTRPSPSLKRTSRPARQVVGHVMGHQASDHQASDHQASERQVVEPRQTAPEVVAARWSADADLSPDNIVNDAAHKTIVPGETLLVVRTTRRVGPDSWVWSVCVWRVTWVNRAQNQVERRSVAKKT
jgi:beta-lactamase regulating signal transducer with metallopeptidase domain